MSINVEEMGRLWKLTRTEQTVAVLLIRGSSNSNIAATLGRSIKTVEAHITRIFKKSGCSTRIAFFVKTMHQVSHQSGLHDLIALQGSNTAATPESDLLLRTA